MRGLDGWRYRYTGAIYTHKLPGPGASCGIFHGTKPGPDHEIVSVPVVPNDSSTSVCSGHDAFFQCAERKVSINASTRGSRLPDKRDAVRVTDHLHRAPATIFYKHGSLTDALTSAAFLCRACAANRRFPRCFRFSVVHRPCSPGPFRRQRRSCRCQGSSRTPRRAFPCL